MRHFAFLVIAAVCAFAQVKTYTVAADSDLSGREFAAVVYSKNEIAVSTKLSGYIKKMAVEEGDRVKKGSLLFEIDATDAKTAKEQANANYLSAKAVAVDAAKDIERYHLLYDKGLVSARDFEKMSLTLQIKKQQENAAFASFEQAKNLSSYTSVRASEDGIVTKKLSGAGQLAMPGQPILILNSTSELRIKADIDEADASLFSKDSTVSATVPSLGKTFSVKVLSVAPTGSGHSYGVKFSVQEGMGLMPGMYVKIVAKKSPKSSHLSVVPSVLTKRGGITGVFALNGRTAKFIPVGVQRTLADRVEVSGLPVGTVLIEYPKADLVDGKTVE